MNHLVIGAGFGDEGKGQTVARIVAANPDDIYTIVRFNGGPQCGHTIHVNGLRHVCAQFGSGVLQGCGTYWSEFCPFDPVAWIKELTVLETLGLKPALSYYLHAKAPIVTPWDIAANRKSRYSITTGTVGAGHGTTLNREEALRSLQAGDLLHTRVLREKVNLVKNFYEQYYSVTVPEDVETAFYANCSEVVALLPGRIGYEPPYAAGSDDLIYEGGQGLMLDYKIGFFPHVTRGNAGTLNLNAWDLDEYDFDHIYLVTRAYATRHGNGPLPGDEHAGQLHLQNTEGETNQMHPFQGEFRRTILDAHLLAYAMYRDTILRDAVNDGPEAGVELVVTCLDQMITWPLLCGECREDQGDEIDFVGTLASKMGLEHSIRCHSASGLSLDSTS